MAESVDALVSNTNVRKDVPVRPRLRVPQKPQMIHRQSFEVFCIEPHRRTVSGRVGSESKLPALDVSGDSPVGSGVAVADGIDHISSVILHEISKVHVTSAVIENGF